MKQQRAQDLRMAVNSLPLGTRRAMLKGLEKNSIIVGADGNVRGGRCPMLAASVASSKTTGKPFARAWDSYAGVRFSRPATKRELLTLRTMLESSIDAETESPVDLTAALGAYERSMSASPARQLAEEPPPADLGAAIAAHEAMVERSRAAELAAAEARTRRERRPDTAERDRTSELEGRHGWAWLRPFRRYDDFERALQQLDEAERAGLAAYAEQAEAEPEVRRRGSEDRELVGTPPGGW